MNAKTKNGLIMLVMLSFLFCVVVLPAQATQKPVADLSVSKTSGNAPLTVKFTDKSTGGKALWKWWGFGDGTGSNSTANTIEHTYKKAGTYKVFLKVTNTAGSDTSDFQYITVCPTIKNKGTVSTVSWGETSSIYPTQNNLYKPSKWDQTKTCELLKARAGIQLVSTRNSNVRTASPGNTYIDNILKPYHYFENFPSVDSKISDSKVKWFYISTYANKPTVHPGVKGSKLVKSYGPFYNVGGGDVPKGDVYINFYKK
ncbi:PKD domain-containing protein [Methanosarcina sp.]|uniref:PKD domain-containing protein n=1 Tax=Methanosarcina sp. TaxID=2213 RepID=UPI003C715F26